MSILRRIETLVFPNLCPACKQERIATHNSIGVCNTCAKSLIPLPTPRCKACGGIVDGVLEVCGECAANPCRNWDHAVTVYAYGSYVRHLIHRFKYRGTVELAPGFARVMADSLTAHSVLQPDAIIAVPMHWRRKFMRGYNQAEILASLIGRIISVPCIRPLKRTKNSKRQATLDFDKRRKNVEQVFSAKRKTNLEGYHIVLIDDILTTGATLDSATIALKEAGAAVVEVLTLARG
ncbi:MAG: ComF family protein [Lentisphaeria bacterium]